RQNLPSALIARTQELDDFVGQFAFCNKRLQTLLNLVQSGNAGVQFGLNFIRALSLTDVGHSERTHHERQHRPKPNKGDDDHAERYERDERGGGKGLAVVECEGDGARGGKGNDAAHAGESDYERLLPWRRWIAAGQ